MTGQGSTVPAAHLTLVMAALLLLAAAATAACTIGPGADGAGPAAATGAPASSVAPAAVQSAAPTAPTPVPEPPPAAVLRGQDVEPVAGTLGGYVYGESGSEAPWIPAAGLEAVALAPGVTLEITLEGGSIAGWALRVATEADTQGESAQQVLAGDVTAGEEAIRFAAPPTGRWVLEARITYADSMGDGAYYWLLDVAPP